MTQRPIFVDAHQDMAWNMVCLDRDYTRTVAETRALEHGKPVIDWNQDTLLGWDAYQGGRTAVVFSTLFACPIRHQEGDWDTQCYRDTEEAHTIYRRQLDAYHELVETHPDKFTLLQTRPELLAHLESWENAGEDEERPVGLVILMEAADGVRTPEELELWWELGVRLIGPAWAKTRFCGGTGEPGPLTKEGYALLEGMAEFPFILDLSHMDETAALQALDAYPQRIVASHANAKALLKGTESNRFLTDRLIEGLLERDGVIGVVPYNRFLDMSWSKSDPRERVTLDALVAQIDYICQMAGNARHVGVGSDADGGFGLQSVPAGIDTLADFHKIAPLLSEKGYTEADIAAVLGGNWLRVLKESLPETV